MNGEAMPDVGRSHDGPAERVGMFGEQLRCAIEAAPRIKLAELAAALWRAHAAGAVEDDEAQALAELIEVRKVVPVEKVVPRHVGSRPRSAGSLERRRRWVAAGMMPPRVAGLFTMGEAAALAVIAAEVSKRGRCELVIGAIAATAGVSITTTKNALREARRLGLIEVRERRMAWNRNASNVVRIVAPEWTAWLRIAGRRGGGKFASPTHTNLNQKAFAPFEKATKEARERFSGPLARSRQRGRTN